MISVLFLYFDKIQPLIAPVGLFLTLYLLLILRIVQQESMNLALLKQNNKKDVSGFPTVSIALLGDTPTQLLALAVKGYGVEEKIAVQLFEAEYNQIDYTILNTKSTLYDFQAKFIVIFESSEKLVQKFNTYSLQEQQLFAKKHIEKVKNYIETINGHSSSTILYSNFMEINDFVFGNYACKVESSFLTQIRKINSELQELCLQYKNFFVNDFSSLQNFHGRKFTFSESIYANTGIIHSTEFIPFAAKNIIDIVKAHQGKIKKCLILDLDNTLWGGIIGDDGLEGIQIGNLGIGETFSRFQSWIKQLKNRGIILAVCSKNEKKAAMEPFINHPDMVLRLDDIAVFMANWNNKADNIREIQSVLNIGFDSMVFIDDNPVERQIVRENVPDILVPELPNDPAEYLAFLQNLNLFETNSFSEEDLGRTRLYLEESNRMSVKKSYVNEDDFLKSLEMKATVSTFQKQNIPRVSQLTQRSNQFNLRTIRYSEEELTRLAIDGNFLTFSFQLKDIYGDNGLVCAIILEKINNDTYLINTWLMSCRVLKRGLENLVLNQLVEIARENGIETLIGEYLPTLKNEMVKNHYLDLGFIPAGKENNWHLEISNYSPKVHFIEIEK